jgi:malate dehydrogenase (oxaloacetate-decarboxylating)
VGSLALRASTGKQLNSAPASVSGKVASTVNKHKPKYHWSFTGPLDVSKRGYDLIRDPLLNKSSAFTAEERDAFRLHGLLPTRVNTMDEQSKRIHSTLTSYADPLKKYIAMTALHDRNEHLYYRILCEHLEEFMPIVYTPTVGLASKNFSQVFQRERGTWITPEMRGRIKEVLSNAVGDREIALVVVTDNESILGIGDQGAGGMAISVGKLSLYTACAGIHPGATLPVSLDVGTGNEALRNDPLYLGWRHERLRGQAYAELVEEFVAAVAALFPGALLQWEDFRKDNALALLDRYRHRLLSFNDDIQGTGAVALAGLYSACRVADQSLRDQRIVILGAGAAGLGIARQIKAGLRLEGVAENQLAAHVAVLDSRGLIVSDREFRDAYKRELAWPVEQAVDLGFADPEQRDLANVVARFKATALIGTSGQAGAFSESIVRQMASEVERPIVLPFSNPTDYAEATPADVLQWTEGRALVATGSPFDPVDFAGRRIEIGQGNNVFIFPGLGLGALLSGVSEISDEMISVSARALAHAVTDAELARGLLYPAVSRLREVTATIATAVIEQAVAEGNGELPAENILDFVTESMWEPVYPEYVPVAGRI